MLIVMEVKTVTSRLLTPAVGATNQRENLNARGSHRVATNITGWDNTLNSYMNNVHSNAC